MLKSVLEQHIGVDWANGPDMTAEYKVNILSRPHCEHATPFRDTAGKTMWKCIHEADPNPEGEK